MDPFVLMQKLVGIPSVFPEEEQIGSAIAQLATELGCAVQKVQSGEHRYNLVVTSRPSPHYLGFYGHIDTVPPAAHYTRDPYTVITEGSNALGLGVCDMKGGLACILTALEHAVKTDSPVKAVFGVDEENISVGAHHLVDSGLMNDIDFLVVAESGQVNDTSKAYSLGYGRKGRILIEAVVQGVQAHAAEAHKGENAIVQAAKLCTCLAEYPFPSHPRLGPSSIVVQQIAASADSFSVPDRCTIRFSLLSSPGTTSDEVIRDLSIKSAALGVRASLRVVPRETPYCEAYELDRSNGFLKILEGEIFSRDGVSAVYNPSVADECIFAHRLSKPVLTLGPIGAGDHTAHEWVSIPSLRKTAEVFKEIVDRYAR